MISNESKASDYRKTPLSIPELNKWFQVTLKDGTVFNQVEKDFKSYLAQFSVLKKKFEQVEVIKNQFKQLNLSFQTDLEEREPDINDKTLRRCMKKFKQFQAKAWSLNLINENHIRTVCDPKSKYKDLIPNEWLKQIATIIKNENHE